MRCCGWSAFTLPVLMTSALEVYQRDEAVTEKAQIPQCFREHSADV